jgi:glycosyltransferase involved in cell wall biosynthesis
MTRPLTILCAAKLHANQLERHLELFEHIPEVGRVLVVRHAPLSSRLSKVENRVFGGGGRAIQALRMFQTIDDVLKHEAVDWVISFNPVPWGSIALAAARRHKVPVCLSLIGMDYLQVQRLWGRPFLHAIRLADAVTVTGDQMVEGLRTAGVHRDRIRTLPHSVDLTRFAPKPGPKSIDIVSIGQLIPRKRMDVVLTALQILKQQGTLLQLGILGKGPLESALKQQAERLGIAEQVQFLGYRNDVESLLASARAFCLCSEWEGVPFAMMEAMSAGLPPIVTNVGTIADWVTDGHNGRIVPVGDSRALATCLSELFASDGRALAGLTANLLAERERLGFDNGAAVWRQILGLSA